MEGLLIGLKSVQNGRIQTNNIERTFLYFGDVNVKKKQNVNAQI